MEIESARVQIDEEDEEEIEIIHERQDLLSKAKKASKKPSCQRSFCKACVIGVAIVVFIAMMVQIWGDYGEYIQTNTFPPKLSSMFSFCPEDTNDTCMTKNYRALKCEWANSKSISCTGNKPEHHMVDVNIPVNAMSWHEQLNITFYENVDKCVHVTIRSI